MITLTIDRKYPKDTYTIGRLYIDGAFLCNTLELPWRDNRRNVSCIPKGEYTVVLTYSAKFKRKLPLIVGVPNRDGIRFHRGNRVSDSTGCVLVGENSQKGMVLNSTHYEQTLVSLLEKEKTVTLNIF